MKKGLFANYQGDDGFTIGERYVDLDSYKQNSYVDRYIAPEYIIDIKDVK